MSSPRFFLEQESPPLLSDEAQRVLQQGKQYAAALLQLVPDLAQVTNTDRAVAFDVGSGADAVAFRQMGFQHASITNSPSVTYQMTGGEERETQTQRELFPYFPQDTYISSLGISDWLQFPKFAPRLLTMLRMAPHCFSDEEDPARFLTVFLPYLRRLQPQQSVILSALNDHPQSELAFTTFAQKLTAENIPHQLLLNEQVTPELETLGSRLLVIYGKSEPPQSSS